MTDLERAREIERKLRVWEFDHTPDRWIALLMIHVAAARREARAEALEEAARLHEQVYVGHHQDPMAAVIEYRDLILALKDKRDD